MSRPLAAVASANPDQVPVAFHWLAAILGQDTAANLDRVSAVDLQARWDAWPQEEESESAAKLPVAERWAAQLSREVAASLDQVGQGALASHGQVHLEASANLDQECQEASADYDRDARQEELERLELRYNTRFLHVLRPYFVFFILGFFEEIFHFSFRRIYQGSEGQPGQKQERLLIEKKDR